MRSGESFTAKLMKKTDNAKPCAICRRKGDKPQIYKGDPWCSDRHRKVFQGEVEPTRAEMETMDRETFLRMEEMWGESEL